MRLSALSSSSWQKWILLLILVCVAAAWISPVSASPATDWSDKGYSLLNTGQYDEALAAFNTAIIFDPNAASAWNGKGQTLVNLGRYDEALVADNKAIELDPNDANAWSGQGLALFMLGRYDEALVADNKAIELVSNNAYVGNYKGNIANLWNSKGLTLFMLGRYDEALAAFNKAIELDPNNAKAKTNRDVVLSKLSQGRTTIVTTSTTQTPSPIITTINPNQTSTPFNQLIIIGIILFIGMVIGGYFIQQSRKKTKGFVRIEPDRSTPQNGTIHAVSIPSGAKIYIDGTYVGISSVTIRDVRPGNHTLEAKLNGYDSNVQQITINPGQTGLYSPDLKNSPTLPSPPIRECQWEELVVTRRKGQTLTLFAKLIEPLCDRANEQYIQGNIAEAKRLRLNAEREIDLLKGLEEKIRLWKDAGYDTSTLESLKGENNSNLIHWKAKDYEGQISRLEKIGRDLQELPHQYPAEFTNPKNQKAVELLKAQLKNPQKISDIEEQFALIKKNIEKISLSNSQLDKQIQIQLNLLTKDLENIRGLGIDIPAFLKRAKSQNSERTENDLKA